MRTLLFSLILLAVCASCHAKDGNPVEIYYSCNPSFVHTLDSISNLNPKYNIKNYYIKQNFYVIFRTYLDKLYVFITHCRLRDDEFGSEYQPFGCVIKNDSFFYLIKSNECEFDLESLFKKTNNKIVPQLETRDDDIDNDNVYFFYRESRMYVYNDGKFDFHLPHKNMK